MKRYYAWDRETDMTRPIVDDIAIGLELGADNLVRRTEWTVGQSLHPTFVVSTIFLREDVGNEELPQLFETQAFHIEPLGKSSINCLLQVRCTHAQEARVVHQMVVESLEQINKEEIINYDRQEYGRTSEEPSEEERLRANLVSERLEAARHTTKKGEGQ